MRQMEASGLALTQRVLGRRNDPNDRLNQLVPPGDDELDPEADLIASLTEEQKRRYVVELPLACRILRKASAGDCEARDAVVETGLLPLAAAGHVPGETDSPFIDLCSTPCSCS